jgi:hypothetical protein
LATAGLALGLLAATPSEGFQSTASPGTTGVTKQTLRSAVTTRTKAVADRVRDAQRRQTRADSEFEDGNAEAGLGANRIRPPVADAP